MSARRRLKGLALTAGEAQGLQMPEAQPTSILKRDATLRKTPDLTRPSIADYFSGHNRSVPGSDVGENTPEDVPWSSPASVGNSGGRGATAKFLTPTPQASKTSSRKGKLSFFKS